MGYNPKNKQDLTLVKVRFVQGFYVVIKITVPKQLFWEDPVPTLHDALVPVNIDPTAPHLDRVLCQQLVDRTHELAPRVNLKELQPPQGASLVNPSQAIGSLCRGLASQRLSLFVARGHINDCESLAVCFPPYKVMWQKEQIRLVDLVGHCHVKLRLRYAPWGQADRSARWPAF